MKAAAAVAGTNKNTVFFHLSRNTRSRLGNDFVLIKRPNRLRRIRLPDRWHTSVWLYSRRLIEQKVQRWSRATDHTRGSSAGTVTAFNYVSRPPVNGSARSSVKLKKIVSPPQMIDVKSHCSSVLLIFIF